MESKQKEQQIILRTQIEYYMSDENLLRDKFFHQKISEDAEGYLDVQFFLNCNKIKKLEVTKEDIIAAASGSSLVEVKGNLLRRTGNKALPELKLLSRKTQRSSDEIGDESGDVTLDPVILEISTEKTPEFKWKAIQDEFKTINPSLNVVYLRFSGNSGHIGLYKLPGREVSFENKIEVEGLEFTVQKCEGDNLINFWKDHGSHFEMCVSKNKKRDAKGRKSKRDPNILKNAVKLGDESFTDLARVKARARKILTSTKDGEKINTSDHEFLFDLLKSHRNFESKTKDIEFFTTGKPREFDYSRCFYIVRKDESKEDFSVNKSIERIGFDDKKR